MSKIILPDDDFRPDDQRISRRGLLAACGASATAAALGSAGQWAWAAEEEVLDLKLLSSRHHACLDMPIVPAGASLAEQLLSPVEQAILDREGSAVSALAAAAAPLASVNNVPSADIPLHAPARAAYANRWPALPNNTLKIAFVNGIRALQDGVIDIARKWCDYADLKFEPVTRGRGEHILIRFHRGFGHFSHIGKESKNQVDSGQPSMNFAFLDRTTFDLDEKYNQFVILHEFGHALGCIHEHQHPGATIRFRENDPRVIQYFQRGLGTTNLETIRFNVFRRWDKPLLKFGVSEYDERSIMHYAFPGWMFQDGKERSQNHELSKLDQYFAALVYPTPDGPKVSKPDKKKDLPTPPKPAPPGDPQGLKLNGGSVAAAISPGTSAAFRFTLTATEAAGPVTIATEGTTAVVLQLYPAGDRSRELTPSSISGGSGYGTYDFTNGAIQASLNAGSYDVVVRHVSTKGGGKFSVALKSGEQYRRLFAPNVAR